MSTTVAKKGGKFHLTTTFETDSPYLKGLLLGVNKEADAATKLEVQATLHQWAAADCVRQAERLRAEAG